MRYILIFLIILLFISIIFFTVNKSLTIEHFCKIPDINPRGGINDKRVYLDGYLPQTNIYTSSCDKYWKDWPLEVNNTLVQNNPIVIKSDQLEMPPEKQFGDSMYQKGLIDFGKLADMVNDKNDNDIFITSTKLIVDPVTKEKIEYNYELDFALYQLNEKTNVNRWKEYNPSVKTTFPYDEIKSPIEQINILNMLFKERCDVFQKFLLTNDQLIRYGLIPFQIFKYKILEVRYFSNDVNKPLYIVEIALFRESDYYLNTFSYVGFIKDNVPSIINVEYIGRNSTDNILLADFYDPKSLKQEIINQNFSNTPVIEKDPDAIVKLTKDYQEGYKLKNQYACFNINFDPSKKENKDVILPYYSREPCESALSRYGDPKSVGVYDTPCKKDEDCPFFKINKNYENDYGKCLPSGYCELPINMERIGYRYFKNDPSETPLCYNCKTKDFEVSTDLDDCCDEQFDKEKYPHLNSPDYAFKDDYLSRVNYFNTKFCTEKPGTSKLECKKIVIS
jgi:hypothetical protein